MNFFQDIFSTCNIYFFIFLPFPSVLFHIFHIFPLFLNLKNTCTFPFFFTCVLYRKKLIMQPRSRVILTIAQKPVCVCVFSSHSFWTSSSLDVPAGVTQEEGHTGFLIHLLYAVRALIFLARRIQPFFSLVDRKVEFCVLTIKSFSTRWAFLFLFFSFLVRKIPFAGIELTSQRVRGLRGTSELPGRPVKNQYKKQTNVFSVPRKFVIFLFWIFFQGLLVLCPGKDTQPFACVQRKI